MSPTLLTAPALLEVEVAGAGTGTGVGKKKEVNLSHILGAGPVRGVLIYSREFLRAWSLVDNMGMRGSMLLVARVAAAVREFEAGGGGPPLWRAEEFVVGSTR